MQLGLTSKSSISTNTFSHILPDRLSPLIQMPSGKALHHRLLFRPKRPRPCLQYLLPLSLSMPLRRRWPKRWQINRAAVRFVLTQMHALSLLVARTVY